MINNVLGELDLSFLISKTLGYTIIVASVILKVPQIMKMIQIKSDKGLSYLTAYSEIMVFVFSFLYSYNKGNPFSTYGENVFIFIQSLIILILSWRYSQQTKCPVTFYFRASYLTILALFIVVALHGTYVPEFLWSYMASSLIPLSTISKMSQIWVSYKSKDTGSLSMMTFLLNFSGCLARMFTTYTETKDLLLVLTYAYGGLLNLVIVFQIFLYGSAKIDQDKKEQ